MRSFEGYGEDTAKYLQYEPANEEDGTQLLDMKSDLKESSSAQRASKFCEIVISDCTNQFF